MNRVAIQSLFEPEVREPLRWRSYATSGLIHFVSVAALLVVALPAVKLVKPPLPRVIEIVPDIPLYHSPTIRPQTRIAKLITPPQPVPPPIHPKFPEPVVTPQPLAEKSSPLPPKVEITAAIPKPVLPEVQNRPPQQPVITNTFTTADTNKEIVAAKELKLGAFGDPNGARPNAQGQERIQLARVGSFDAGPPPASTTVASGGAVRATFGSVESPGIVSNNGGSNVQTGQFGDSKPAQMHGPATAAPAAPPPLAPVEILFKPKPAYTVEARNLKIEGQVALEVVFLSNGEVRIVRVIHGLGHGLDEAAQEAAQKVRFRPAMRGGIPVDTNATIYITFELT